MQFGSLLEIKVVKLVIENKFNFKFVFTTLKLQYTKFKSHLCHHVTTKVHLCSSVVLFDVCLYTSDDNDIGQLIGQLRSIHREGHATILNFKLVLLQN